MGHWIEYTGTLKSYICVQWNIVYSVKNSSATGIQTQYTYQASTVVKAALSQLLYQAFVENKLARLSKIHYVWILLYLQRQILLTKWFGILGSLCLCLKENMFWISFYKSNHIAIL